jgi:hypothetical protein
VRISAFLYASCFPAQGRTAVSMRTRVTVTGESERFRSVRSLPVQGPTQGVAKIYPACELHRKDENWCLGYKKVKQSRYTPWRRLGERRYSSYSFITSALDRGEWSASRSGRVLPPGKWTPGTHCTGAWVGPRAGLDTEATGKILSPLPGIEPRSPGSPARSQTLY